MSSALGALILRGLKMGKIVKFCNACDEGFAEKFGFCPNCGQSLHTFEMNAVVAEVPAMQEVVAAPVPVAVPGGS